MRSPRQSGIACLKVFSMSCNTLFQISSISNSSKRFAGPGFIFPGHSRNNKWENFSAKSKGGGKTGYSPYSHGGFTLHVENPPQQGQRQGEGAWDTFVSNIQANLWCSQAHIQCPSKAFLPTDLFCSATIALSASTILRTSKKAELPIGPPGRVWRASNPPRLKLWLSESWIRSSGGGLHKLFPSSVQAGEGARLGRELFRESQCREQYWLLFLLLHQLPKRFLFQWIWRISWLSNSKVPGYQI